MKTALMPWPAVKPEVAFQIAPEIYRLRDFRLAVLDPAVGQALIIEIEPAKPKRRKEC